ncbi:PRC-barrel domain containing protein [Mucilaginibacter terrenus]|uniref:PRC-barrel domain containing protein n=1 Tax=Mucilaginibacter terrenus TaxID=2482727 RepID=A0A3E2NUP1_9SPHI|nr:PRC-barrel domain-containing protein [Mucilaginibacter terrenus]RFZ84677.1 PRC-barrel domain containing protein [Mucilaginibacter terrenus]
MASTDNTDDISKLTELSDSDFEIADGQPDIQGWDVRDSEGNKLGEVDELLFNPASRKVRYIIVHMENNDIGLEDGRVLMPIGVAELDEHKDNVIIPDITKAQILSLPLYEYGRDIDSDTEAQIRNVFVAPDANVMVGTDFYDHDHFNQTKFYGKRREPGADTVSKSYLDTPPEGNNETV